MKALVLTTATVLLVSSLASAGTLTVGDGSLLDWGIDVQDDNGSNITGYTNPGDIGLLGWMSEDTNDNSNSYSLGPDSGGQNYDAEFLAAAVQDDKLFLAIVSGQRPDNEFRNYAPGDIRIETASGVFGVEVGGGADGLGGPGEFIVAGDSGSTFKLFTNGHTDSVTNHITQKAGSVWKNATWERDPIDPPGEFVQQISGGIEVGMANYYFSRNSFTDEHSIIELSVDLSVFGGALHDPFDIYWRPSCGNDELELHLEAVHMPLPGAFVPGLLSLAVLGVGAAIRRRRRQAAA